MRLRGQKSMKSTTMSLMESKLRSHEIRLNFRSIVTDVRLHGFEIAICNLCTFCLEESETLIH